MLAWKTRKAYNNNNNNNNNNNKQLELYKRLNFDHIEKGLSTDLEN